MLVRLASRNLRNTMRRGFSSGGGGGGGAAAGVGGLVAGLAGGYFAFGGSGDAAPAADKKVGKTQAVAYHTAGEKDAHDPKSVPGDFVYTEFTQLPKFSDKHRCLLKKYLTQEMFDQLKDKKTSKGYTLSNCIQAGVQCVNLGIGATAGDSESWKTFAPLLNPIIKEYHKFDPETQRHHSDLDPSKIEMSPLQQRKFDEYVISTRIRAARNIEGFALPGGTDAKDRAGVESVLKSAFENFEGNLKGKYYSLGNLTEDEVAFLQSNGYLFQKPGPRNVLANCGAARSWPDNRGIFHNNSHTALSWVNEEDHCRIISMVKGGNVKKTFETFCDLSHGLAKAAEKNGTELMFDETLGFLGTCPSNLGTGLRASVMIKLPYLNKNVELLEKICKKYDLQPRGSAGEHSAAIGGKWDISNSQRLGYSEVQLVQKMIDGVTELIKLEERLAEVLGPIEEEFE